MINQEGIEKVLYLAVDELNEELPPESKLEKKAETVLYGENSKLDSLGLVKLLVATEQMLEEEFDLSITLADDRAMSQSQSPFRTIGSLAGYIVQLVEEPT